MINEKLYKISIQSIMNNITLDGAAIIFDDSGMAFVEIHPADAVEVVRCKDCKHFIQEEHGCNHFGYYSHTPWVDEVDFCSYGERKDND